VSISNSTFANNSATNAGGGLFSYNGAVSITGSIVADNSNSNCYGSLTDQGYDLSSDSSCHFTGTGSLQNTNPMLASALANNGRPTQTLALLDGSPAINKVPSGSSCPSTDQRGISRPQGPACDIGVFEFRVPVLNLPTSPITVNATGTSGATVTYTATASEPDDASATPTANCTPPSGSTFPIGPCCSAGLDTDGLGTGQLIGPCCSAGLDTGRSIGGGRGKPAPTLASYFVNHHNRPIRRRVINVPGYVLYGRGR
jgi:hypothetical protein